MEPNNEITGEFILKNRRSKRTFEVPPDVEIASPDARQINRAAGERFAKGSNAGVWKRITTMVLEPANPFNQKAPRRPRPEAIVLGSLILSLLALAIYFNFLVR